METMTLEQLYYIGEMIGVIAVVVTLIFLTVQVRQNTKLMKTHGLQEAIAHFILANPQATSDVLNAKNFRMGLNDFNALSRDEKAVFHSKMHILIAGFGQVLSLYKNGLLIHAEFTTMEGFFLRAMLCPGAQQWWEQFKHMTPMHFMSHVDKRIQEESANIKPFSEELDWYKID